MCPRASVGHDRLDGAVHHRLRPRLGRREVHAEPRGEVEGVDPRAAEQEQHHRDDERRRDPDEERRPREPERVRGRTRFVAVSSIVQGVPSITSWSAVDQLRDRSSARRLLADAPCRAIAPSVSQRTDAITPGRRRAEHLPREDRRVERRACPPDEAAVAMHGHDELHPHLTVGVLLGRRHHQAAVLPRLIERLTRARVGGEIAVQQGRRRAQRRDHRHGIVRHARRRCRARRSMNSRPITGGMRVGELQRVGEPRELRRRRICHLEEPLGDGQHPPIGAHRVFDAPALRRDGVVEPRLSRVLSVRAPRRRTRRRTASMPTASAATPAKISDRPRRRCCVFAASKVRPLRIRSSTPHPLRRIQGKRRPAGRAT